MGEPGGDRITAEPSRASRDRLAIAAIVTSALAALTCMPFLAMFGGMLGFVARRRARIAGRTARLATAAIAVAATSIALQWALWNLSSRWLLPNMQRRMTAAVSAACEGRWRDAVPAVGGAGFATPLPAPTEAAMATFGERLQAARGPLRSVSLVNEEISGSPMAPTVSTALVLDFARGSATGSARMQWLPSAAEGEAEWLPTVRLLELEVTLPDGGTLSLRADGTDGQATDADPAPTPRKP